MSLACKLKSEHLSRLGFQEAHVENGKSFNIFNINFFNKPAARTLAVIPTKNLGVLLRTCIETILKTTKGLNLDIVVVNHESDDPQTIEYLNEISTNKTATVISWTGTFNYSTLNNYAIDKCGAGYDHFLFLNNDIEAIQEGWLEPMIDLASREDIGAVGATLLYPDGRIQHAGVVIGIYNCAEHAFKFSPFNEKISGYLGSLHANREYSAVTAACMLVPADAFKSVGGYDETLAVGFGDTDLCLRIKAKGYRIVNSSRSVLVHHESITRGKMLDGKDPHPIDTRLFVERYGSMIKMEILFLTSTRQKQSDIQCRSKCTT